MMAFPERDLNGNILNFKEGGGGLESESINYILSSISPTIIHNTSFLT